MESATAKKSATARAAAALCALALVLGAALAPGSAWAAEGTELTSDSFTGGTLSEGTYYLGEDIELTSNVTVASEVTLDLNGHTLTGTGSGSVVTVSAGGNLTLNDSTASDPVQITDEDEIAAFEAGVVQDTDDDGDATGTWTTYYTSAEESDDGTVTTTYWSYTSGAITGGGSTSYGGGIHLTNTGGDDYSTSTFTMNGGTITDNAATYGAGISLMYPYNYGTLYLYINGGSVSGNTAGTYGGGVCLSASKGSSICVMTDGIISGNYSGNHGGGVNEEDTSGSVFDTEFVMEGGVISGNETGTYGGGVGMYPHNTGFTSQDATFDMTGGVICDNEATRGGGISSYSANSTVTSDVTVSDGLIANNEATYGGGVYVHTYGEFSFTGGSILNNTASNTGGGLYVNGGSFGSTATSEDAADESATAGCILANNTASTGGDDVYATSSATLDLSGIDNSSIVYEGDDAGALIDGWYEDGSDARYVSWYSSDGEYNADEVTSTPTGSAYSLVAAYGVHSVTYVDGVGGLAFVDFVAEGILDGGAIPAFDDDADGEADEPELEGLAFAGWSATVDGVDADADAVGSVAGDVVFTATWKRAVPEFDAQACTYDGGAQEFDVGNEAGLEGFEVTYYGDEACTTAVESPVDAGTYWVKISRAEDGTYAAFEQTTTLTVEKATPTVEVSGVTASYDGEAHAATATVAGVDGQAGDSLDGVPVTVSYADEDGGAVAGEDGAASAPVGVGTYTATASYAGSGNYEAASAAATVVVEASEAPFVVESDNSAYDGESHGVLVTPSSEDATVTYSTDGVNYSEECPGFTEVGVHTVYFRIEEPGCADVEGSATVTIE